jgi:hypothetical protein
LGWTSPPPLASRPTLHLPSSIQTSHEVWSYTTWHAARASATAGQLAAVLLAQRYSSAKSVAYAGGGERYRRMRRHERRRELWVPTVGCACEHCEHEEWYQSSHFSAWVVEWRVEDLDSHAANKHANANFNPRLRLHGPAQHQQQ